MHFLIKEERIHVHHNLIQLKPKISTSFVWGGVGGGGGGEKNLVEYLI